MAGYDNGSGWAMIIDSLNQFQQQTDPYNTMDWGKTIANLFRRNKKPQGDLVQNLGGGGQSFILSDPNNPELGGYLAAQDSAPVTSAPEGQMIVPSGTQAHDPRSDYSSDNPNLKWLGNPNSKIVRRMTPELEAALNKWENDKEDTTLGRQMAELKFKSAQNQVDESGTDNITLDEATISQLPEQYQFMYRPGQTVSRGEITKMITPPQFKPGQVVIDEEIFKAIPEQYQSFYPVGTTVNADSLAELIPKVKPSTKGSTTTTNKTWPSAASMSAQQLSSFIRDNISKGATEKELQPYIKQYNTVGSKEGNTVNWTYSQWKSQAEKRPVNGRPQQTKKEPSYKKVNGKWVQE